MPTSASSSDRTPVSSLVSWGHGVVRRIPGRLLDQNVLAGARSALGVLLIRIIGAGLTYVSALILARWLGTRGFGAYAYVLVVVTQLGLAFSLGFNSSSLRFVASYLASGRRRRLAGFLRYSFGFVTLSSLIGAACSAALVVTFRDRLDPDYVEPLLVGCACIPIWTLLNQLESTARGLGQVQTAYVPGYILRPAALIGIIATLKTSGVAVDTEGAVWALFASCAVAGTVQAVLVLRRARANCTGCAARMHGGHWTSVSLTFLTIDAFRILLDNIDVLLIGKILGATDVAIYFAVVRTSGLVSFIPFSVIAFAVPRFAEIHNRGDRRDLQRYVDHVLRLVVWPTLVAALGMLAIGPFLLSLFGADFRAGYPTMVAILIGLVIRTATMPAEYLLNMTGHHRDTVRVYGCAAAASVALNAIAIPTFGLIGAAAASYVAMIGGNLALCWFVRKRLGLSAAIGLRILHAR